MRGGYIVVNDFQMVDVRTEGWFGGKKTMYVEYVTLQIPSSKIDDQPLEENLLTWISECFGHSGQCLQSRSISR